MSREYTFFFRRFALNVAIDTSTWGVGIAGHVDHFELGAIVALGPVHVNLVYAR